MLLEAMLLILVDAPMGGVGEVYLKMYDPVCPAPSRPQTRFERPVQ